MEPFKTSANTYSFDEEVADSVFIALHTEKRNQTQLFKHNGFCLQHIKQLFQYGIWQNELKQNIETEVISRLAVLDRPLKQFAGIVERASSDLKSKLDAYNKDIGENHSKRIIQERFLSNRWDENEMNESEIKIKMLKEEMTTSPGNSESRVGPCRMLRNKLIDSGRRRASGGNSTSTQHPPSARLKTPTPTLQGTRDLGKRNASVRNVNLHREEDRAEIFEKALVGT